MYPGFYLSLVGFFLDNDFHDFDNVVQICPNFYSFVQKELMRATCLITGILLNFLFDLINCGFMRLSLFLCSSSSYLFPLPVLLELLFSIFRNLVDYNPRALIKSCKHRMNFYTRKIIYFYLSYDCSKATIIPQYQ